MFYSINLAGNSKTKIPTTTSSKGTCPDSCPLKKGDDGNGGGCYASYSFLGNYWSKLSKGEVKNSGDFDWLLNKINDLPKGQLWRMNQAGDLDHIGGAINSAYISDLIKVNKGKKGFTYTHHNIDFAHNAVSIQSANRLGFTINLSANNLEQADYYISQKIAPVVTLLPTDAEKVTYTPKGNKIVACPAENSDKINCGNCGLCYLADRDYIIGFRAHGTGKKIVSKIAINNNLIPVQEVA